MLFFVHLSGSQKKVESQYDMLIWCPKAFQNVVTIHAIMHVTGPDWWVCALGGSRKRLPGRSYDPVGSHLVNTSQLYDHIGIRIWRRNKDIDLWSKWIPQHATNEIILPDTSMSIRIKALRVVMCVTVDTKPLGKAHGRYARFACTVPGTFESSYINVDVGYQQSFCCLFSMLKESKHIFRQNIASHKLVYVIFVC